MSESINLVEIDNYTKNLIENVGLLETVMSNLEDRDDETRKEINVIVSRFHREIGVRICL